MRRPTQLLALTLGAAATLSTACGGGSSVAFSELAALSAVSVSDLENGDPFGAMPGRYRLGEDAALGTVVVGWIEAGRACVALVVEGRDPTPQACSAQDGDATDPALLVLADLPDGSHYLYGLVSDGVQNISINQAGKRVASLASANAVTMHLPADTDVRSGSTVDVIPKFGDAVPVVVRAAE